MHKYATEQALSIDGSIGEGGGQILRSSLALSLCLKQPFCMNNIRTARKNPGLMPQHLMAVKAAAELCTAEVRGAELHSQEIFFSPGEVNSGDYHFSIGTAGSTTLLLQTLLPVLLTADGPSNLVLEGGTHNPLAPSYEFLHHVYLPLINRMGPNISSHLEQPGFYPAGGGRVQVHIEPVVKLKPLHLLERGEVIRISASALVANLPEHIAHRELRVLGEALKLEADNMEIRRINMARGPGNALTVMVKSEQITEVFSGVGERGIPAEVVAEKVVKSVRRYLAAGVPVGHYLADQLLLLFALAGKGCYLTLRPSLHTTTNIEVLKKFLDIDITTQEISDDAWHISIG